MNTPCRILACALGACIAALFLAGCEKAEPVVYQIPKEDRNTTVTPVPSGGMAANEGGAARPAGTSMQVLPGMREAADSAGEIRYAVPEGWTEVPASGIRKANLRFEDANGTAELTVLVFPGDVGGMRANINRWLGQIQLDPVDEAGLAALSEPIVVSKHRATFVKLHGPKQSIHGAVLPFHGFTWFFKFQGDHETVTAAEDGFRAFLDSVELEDDHHH